MEKKQKIAKEVHFHKKMIAMVMLTAPIMIPLDILKTAIQKKRQMEQWNSFVTMMNELQRVSMRECKCHKCDGRCHE